MKDSNGTGEGTTPLTSEEYLSRVTIGPRQPLNGTIHLTPYDPQWKSEFERHAQRLRVALGANVLLLEHVGSTSVPGLAAKPVIDILLAVADSSDEKSYVPQLEEEGFVLRIREPEWFEHRLLKSPGDSVNLHVFSIGCEEIGRMLAFRDWLRTNDHDRRLYERTKRTLAAQSWKHTQDYANAKSTVVQEILARAVKPEGQDRQSPGVP